MGYSSSSFPTDATTKAIANGQDFIVATKADPIDQRWRFEGTKGNYRYYRMEQ